VQRATSGHIRMPYRSMMWCEPGRSAGAHFVVISESRVLSDTAISSRPLIHENRRSRILYEECAGKGFHPQI
jgi:hypothetical protein